MQVALRIACPNCGVANRIPPERFTAARGAECGKCKTRLFPGHPLAIDTEARFLRHLEHDDIPLLVDFWAPWCGPCRTMAPEFEKAGLQLEPMLRLAKVDTEKLPSLAARYGIRGIPTLILFKRGREVARRSGAMPASEIVRFAQSSLGRNVAA